MHLCARRLIGAALQLAGLLSNRLQSGWQSAAAALPHWSCSHTKFPTSSLGGHVQSPICVSGGADR